VGDVDFLVISATENSNKFQKTRFWKEKSVENVVILGLTAQATLVLRNTQFLLILCMMIYQYMIPI
jgi:hypothetical protein